ncbi:MAG: methyltransferase domain-containing protein [Lachnospiraceae bacterium]|jgi:SAM-dependent methyltransferase|nr:methyltransferase domain-containing protein [Lachnospiraceae bacterium]
MIALKHVDDGNRWDFGNVAEDYAKYRDIYPESFLETLLRFDIGTAGQTVLDLGTGSGVIPRFMEIYGAKWTGTDLSPSQIEMAKSLENTGNIDYITCPADQVPLADGSFDVVTACQCFWYFPVETTIPEIKRLLKRGGKLAILSMIGLPRESAILAKSEELVLKYNPNWNGCNLDRVKLTPPDWLGDSFSVVALHEYVEEVAFTRKSWCGRMRACRGVGATLPPDLVKEYDKEHFYALCNMAGEVFTIPHQFLFQIYRVNKE